jgi:2-keto-4-pentenoate hydratase/2-oxohepta-3-ene-1,7-dioic acid hydratase in catechol pathway
MRLATFTDAKGSRVGAVVGDEIADLSEAVGLPTDMVELLSGGRAMLDAARDASTRVGRVALDAVKLQAPVPRPGKFLAIGLNYADHIREVGAKTPENPSCFAKMPTSIVGPYDDIQRPVVSDALDYEGELGLVFGRRCKHVPRERARDVVAGFFVANDVSVRDWQRSWPQVVIPKSFDTHGPFGPWITTTDEIGDPHDLGIRTVVNGEERQNSSTSEMVFDCWHLIEILSRAVTFEPGDVLITGTPPGVAMGMPSPRWLEPGDLVTVEIDGLGRIENRVVQEPATAMILD